MKRQWNIFWRKTKEILTVHYVSVFFIRFLFVLFHLKYFWTICVFLAIVWLFFPFFFEENSSEFRLEIDQIWCVGDSYFYINHDAFI